MSTRGGTRRGTTGREPGRERGSGGVAGQWSTYSGEDQAAVAASLFNVEPTIALRGREFGFAFSPTGREVGRFTSADSNVDSLRIPYDEETRNRLFGSIFTHNHPNNSTFSDNDIKNTLRLDLREMRAVNEQHTYVLRTKGPTGAWRRDWPQIETALNGYRDRVNAELATWREAHPGGNIGPELRAWEGERRHAFLESVMREPPMLHYFEYSRIATKMPEGYRDSNASLLALFHKPL